MNFKELLKSKGLSGYAFAKKSDIHQPAVSKFVTGKRDPLNMSVYSAKRAASVLGMSLDEFYDSLDKGEKHK
ncbi:MAG: helix-turn-helix transcriptional regulator [Erysipelothrix sp.]|nr:helix-turn-helix transcriptional regulator [Erysipelothrix sp.]